jgi:hypothetical protein
MFFIYIPMCDIPILNHTWFKRGKTMMKKKLKTNATNFTEGSFEGILVSLELNCLTKVLSIKLIQ